MSKPSTPEQRAARAAYMRKYIAENREKMRAQARARHAANPGKLREKARARSAAWYATHREDVLAESKAWREANVQKSRQMSRDWRSANPDKVRDLQLKKYGITGAQWDSMFESQGSACAVCRSADPSSKKGWHTDHDHNTGAVRGILCHPCNVSLGHIGDSLTSVVLRSAQLARYLADQHANQNSIPALAGLLLCI